MRALLDLLSSHSERLKEQYPDIHALLRQVRPTRDDWRYRYNSYKLTHVEDPPSSRELKSITKDPDRRSLITNNEEELTEDSSSSSSSGFF